VEGGIDQHTPTLVERQAEPFVHRVRADAGSPDDGARGEPAAVGEGRGVGLDGLEGCGNANVDAASGELARRVVAERDRDLGQDLRGGIDQYPMLRRFS
jgi:hypothetical protein